MGFPARAFRYTDPRSFGGCHAMIDDRRFLLWNILVPLGVVLVLGYFAYGFGYLAFHVFAETISIVIGGTAMIVAHTSQRFARNQYLLLIAVVIGWCMLIDLLHLITYQGMSLLPIDEQNVSLRLWASARGLQALGMLVAIQLMSKRMPLLPFHAIVGSLTLLLIVASVNGWLPDMYEEGLRFSQTKVLIDWTIIGLHLITLSILWRIRHQLPTGVRRFIPASLLAMMLAEVLFSLEDNLFGPANVIGHLLKIMAYWFVYLALLYSTLREPFTALASAARIYDAVPNPTLIIDEGGRISQANAAAGRVLGVPASQLVGKTTHSLFHNTDIEPVDCPVCRALREGEELDRYELLRRHGASLQQVSIRRLSGSEGGQSEFVEVLNDLTEMQQSRDSQRQMESRIERSEHARDLMKALLTLSVAPQINGEMLQSLLEKLPPAFRAPSLLRLQLQSPWLNAGRSGGAEDDLWRRSLDFGAGRSGRLELYYVDPTGSLGGGLDSDERLLAEAFADVLQTVGQRTKD
ncbi:MAG: PAS domain-containing protein [Sinobacteraceae bacterium]|nr:PAS domain-containing protein [Nevskiaceae bacterium]